MVDFIDERDPEPTGDYYVGKLNAYNYDYGDWSGAIAVNFAPILAGKRPLVVGIIASNSTGSSVTLDFYTSTSVMGSITIPANSTKTFFDERGIMLGGAGLIGRTSGSGSGSRTVIWRYV